MQSRSEESLGRRSRVNRTVSGWAARRAIRAQASYREARRQQHDRLLVPEGATVFLGDSLTEGAQWSEWFSDRAAVNRGVGGDTTRGLLDRLDPSLRSAATIVVLIGTNDLSMGRSVHAVADGIALVVDRVVAIAPRAHVILHPIFPRQARFAAEIRWVNAKLPRLTRGSANVVDFWAVFADARGALREDLTFDGLHLNGKGYETWASALRPVLSAHAA